MAKEFLQKHFINEAKAAINHWSGVGGSGGSGGSGSAPSENVVEIDLLPKTKFTSFTSNSMLFGAMVDATIVSFSLTIGETYLVEWDGEVHTAVAKDASVFNAGSIILGNGSLIGIPSNDEPFAIALTGEQLMLMSVDPSKTEHDVRIYRTYTSEDAVLLQDKVASQNGVYVPDEGYDGIRAFTVAVESAGSGGSSGGVVEKDINFYDYDGTLLHSYTLEEANAFTELPPLPEQEGLICQGWNFTLAEVQTTSCPLDIGAIYITDDGKTRIHIHDPDGRTNVWLSLSQTVANGTTVDWGDGSDLYVLPSTGASQFKHVYSEPGDYTISIDVADGCVLTLGDNFDSVINTFVHMYCYIRGVNIGKNVTAITKKAFYKCYKLEYVTIPNGVTLINNESFYYAYDLKHVNIPSSVVTLGSSVFNSCSALSTIALPNSITTIGSNAFNSCVNLQRVRIPNGVTKLESAVFSGCSALTSVVISSDTMSFAGNNFSFCRNLETIELPRNTTLGYSMFSNCFSLTYLKIPKSVISIPASCFTNCSSPIVLDFSEFESVPALANTNAFSNVGPLRIEAPTTLYDEWKNTTNWSTYAAKIVAV